MSKKLNVAITYNLKPDEDSALYNSSRSTLNPDTLYEDTYAEWDTTDTIYAIRHAIELEHKVIMIEANLDCYDKLRSTNIDIVFNVAENANGISREAQIPAILDMLGIPYTGSDPLALATCLDKSRTKEVLTYHSVPNAKFVITDRQGSYNSAGLTFPCIVKPIGEGSSKGIFNSSVVNNERELNDFIKQQIDKYKQPFIIEEYLPGREFTVSILGNGDEAAALPIVEMNYDNFPDNMPHIYSFEAKWIIDTRDEGQNLYICPAKIDEKLDAQIKATALNAYKALQCKDWSRIDVRLDANGTPNIIEINPIPGILPTPEDNSCFPKSAFAAGYNYNEMILAVLNSALKRYGMI